MPCYDARSNGCRERIVHVPDRGARLALAEALDRLDRATQFLCYMIGEYKQKELYDELPDDIKEWSFEHDYCDKKRITTKIKEYIKNGVLSVGQIAGILKTEAEKIHPLSKHHEEMFYNIAKEEVHKFFL